MNKVIENPEPGGAAILQIEVGCTGEGIWHGIAPLVSGKEVQIVEKEEHNSTDGVHIWKVKLTGERHSIPFYAATSELREP